MPAQKSLSATAAKLSAAAVPATNASEQSNHHYKTIDTVRMKNTKLNKLKEEVFREYGTHTFGPGIIPFIDRAFELGQLSPKEEND